MTWVVEGCRGAERIVPVQHRHACPFPSQTVPHLPTTSCCFCRPTPRRATPMPCRAPPRLSADDRRDSPNGNVHPAALLSLPMMQSEGSALSTLPGSTGPSATAPPASPPLVAVVSGGKPPPQPPPNDLYEMSAPDLGHRPTPMPVHLSKPGSGTSTGSVSGSMTGSRREWAWPRLRQGGQGSVKDADRDPKGCTAPGVVKYFVLLYTGECCLRRAGWMCDCGCQSPFGAQ